MKNKIRLRLMLYFVSSFLVFSLVIGIVFFVLFSRHNTDVYKGELENRAVRIAETLSGFLDGSSEFGMMGSGMMGSGMTGSGAIGPMGYGMYMQFIEEIAMSDVWIVDRNLEQITRGHGQMNLTYKDLPAGAEEVITQALSGQTSFSESFGTFLGSPTITVATPIAGQDGDIIGVVLLHSQVRNISNTTNNGLLILGFSIAAGIIISFFVAGVLAGHFTKPLGKMKKAALQISGGNYTAQTGVTQDDEIGELAEVIDEMAGKLDEASQESVKLDKLRRDFMANVSHELRTPVTVIRGSLEALCDGVVKEADKVEEYHRQMLSESIHLERLVSDLLDLARLQNPDFAIEMSRVDLQEIATDVTRSMRRLADPKNIELNLTSCGENFAGTGDYGRLRQMLMIVLDNAIKFSPEGGTVTFELAETENRIKVSIRDEGCGIPQDEIPHLFERFRKQRSEENKNGSGLGLAIARQIADRHGITIEVESQQNMGTTIHFFFPGNAVPG